MLKKYHSLLLAGAFVSTAVFLGAEEATGIAAISDRVSSNLNSVANLISQVAFVAGMGFFVSAVFKFKQHKDNPTQVPIGTPMSMLAISAALMFLGNFISPLGETLFGTGAQAGSASQGIGSGLSDGAGG